MEEQQEINDTVEPPKPRGRPKKPPPPPPPPKEKKPTVYAGREKEYLKNYYQEKMLEPSPCKYCEMILSTQAALRRHWKNNKSCRILQLQLELSKTNHCIEQRTRQGQCSDKGSQSSSNSTPTSNLEVS
jgi:hypothetical protein